MWRRPRHGTRPVSRMVAPQSRTRLAYVRMAHTSRISVIRMATNLSGLPGRLPDVELRRTALLGGPLPLWGLPDGHSGEGVSAGAGRVDSTISGVPSGPAELLKLLRLRLASARRRQRAFARPRGNRRVRPAAEHQHRR